MVKVQKKCSRVCEICGSRHGNLLHTQGFSLPAGHPLGDGYDVVACASCCFVYADSNGTQEAYDRFYSSLSKYADASTSTGSGLDPVDAARLRETAEIIDSFLPDKRQRVLDIGCAGGGLLFELKRLGHKNMVGMDPAEACVRQVQAGGAEAFAGTIETLNSRPETFDAVILSHVLEHVRDLSRSVAVLTKVLSRTGFVYVEVPDPVRYADFNYAPFQEFNTEHINHFSAYHLKRLFSRFGFRATATDSRLLNSPGGRFYPAFYVCFERDGQPAETDCKPDDSVAHQMEKYIQKSQEMMQNIDRKLRETLLGQSRIILWGMGQLSFKLLHTGVLTEKTVIACVDANPMYHGTRIGDADVLPPSLIPDPQTPIVVTTLLHQESVVARIQALGLSNPVITLSV